MLWQILDQPLQIFIILLWISFLRSDHVANQWLIVIYVTLVTQERKYGGKHKDTSVVVCIDLTGFPCNNGTFNTTYVIVYINGISNLIWEHCIHV